MSVHGIEPGLVSPESVWILYRVEPGGALLPGSLTIGDEIAVTPSVEALRASLEENRVVRAHASHQDGARSCLPARPGWSTGQGFAIFCTVPEPPPTVVK